MALIPIPVFWTYTGNVICQQHKFNASSQKKDTFFWSSIVLNMRYVKYISRVGH